MSKLGDDTNNSCHSATQGGFSLIELSIVLMIVSIMYGVFFSFMGDKAQIDKINDTNTALDAIEKAIALYVYSNKALPCPSDASLDISNTNFGRSNGVAGSCNNTTGTTTTVTTIAIGGVPNKTLNIRDEYALDGWGRKINYQVVQACTSSISATSCITPTNSIINIQYADGNQLSTVFSSGMASYVLISYGPNGHGAFTKAGTRIHSINSPTTVSNDEQQNCQYSNTGTATSFQPLFVQKAMLQNTSNYFDDIVRFKNRAMIISMAGLLNNASEPSCELLTLKYPHGVGSSTDVLSICGGTSTSCTNCCASYLGTSTGGVAYSLSNLCVN